MEERFPVEGGEVVLLATVQGLVSERDAVRRAFARVAPAAVALGVSPEAAAALLGFERTPEMEDPFEDLPDHDFVYSLKLREYGEVDLPPPDLLEAARLAKAEGVPLHGVDMPEEQYEDAFTKEVSVWGFLRYGRIQRRLARKPPKAPDAVAFSLAWDAKIRKVKGIAKLETMREARIAAGARALAAQERGRILLVLDVARAAGVRRALAQPAPGSRIG